MVTLGFKEKIDGMILENRQCETRFLIIKLWDCNNGRCELATKGRGTRACGK
ncbi:hypothetical protein HanRHA438_Chr05g0236411 [Helianthus annuus]|nr:hypothetical protein HanRHA438_Chr05g0236411 [Helianthus annuus]